MKFERSFIKFITKKDDIETTLQFFRAMRTIQAPFDVAKNEPAEVFLRAEERGVNGADRWNASTTGASPFPAGIVNIAVQVTQWGRECLTRPYRIQIMFQNRFCFCDCFVLFVLRHIEVECLRVSYSNV